MLFDWGGTLDADGVTWKDRMRRLYAEEGHAAPAPRFDRAFYDADDALVGRLGEGATLDETADRLAAGVQAGLGLTDSALARRIGARFAAAARGAVARNTPLLELLAARYRLGVVSNFYGNLRAVCLETGVARLLGAMVDSTAVGATKPDPRIFRAALDTLGVAPAHAVFVGDSLPRDMAGARDLGMPHIWLAPEPGARPCCPGDPVIPGLPALAGLLA